MTHYHQNISKMGKWQLCLFITEETNMILELYGYEELRREDEKELIHKLWKTYRVAQLKEMASSIHRFLDITKSVKKDHWVKDKVLLRIVKSHLQYYTD